MIRIKHCLSQENYSIKVSRVSLQFGHWYFRKEGNLNITLPVPSSKVQKNKKILRLNPNYSRWIVTNNGCLFYNTSHKQLTLNKYNFESLTNSNSTLLWY